MFRARSGAVHWLFAAAFVAGLLCGIAASFSPGDIVTIAGGYADGVPYKPATLVVRFYTATFTFALTPCS